MSVFTLFVTSDLSTYLQLQIILIFIAVKESTFKYLIIFTKQILQLYLHSISIILVTIMTSNFGTVIVQLNSFVFIESSHWTIHLD